MGGVIPKLADSVPHNEDGVGGMHLYMPWWLDNAKLDFPRGYHIEFGGGRHQPSYGILGGIERLNGLGGYGTQLKADYRKYYGTVVGFSGRGEMIPNEFTYCEIDPRVVDTYGIPVLRFHWQWSDNEIRMAKDMQETFRSIVEAGGGTFLSSATADGPRPYGIADGGVIIHEIGTARMGSNPKTSVLNKNCQAHDVKNLFVTDGAPFVTNADKNPTLTILALSWRASEYLLSEAKKGNL